MQSTERHSPSWTRIVAVWNVALSPFARAKHFEGPEQKSEETVMLEIAQAITPASQIQKGPPRKSSVVN
jgi:hypothetical protein